ncbi:hypothetical protein LSAT2_001106 [Lamellibrachia satsuma]|nr:hypothetical protein LSAT2_001106 [Lamellibrachia satsuma]
MLSCLAPTSVVTTEPRCVSSCVGRDGGDYQSCIGCNVYVTCSQGTAIDNRPCPGDSVWDDTEKRCMKTSTTCGDHIDTVTTSTDEPSTSADQPSTSYDKPYPSIDKPTQTDKPSTSTEQPPTTTVSLTPDAYHAVKRCRRPRIRQHQEVTWSGINVGDTAEFTCHAEYTLPEGGVARTVVCQPSGQWSASPKCTAVPTVTNAFADTNAAEIGTIVTYTCQGGLRFRSGIDTAQIQCTTHREWFPDVDSCQDRCTTLPYFDHAVLGEGVNGLVSSSARFLCIPGYRFPDGSTLKSINCQKNLEWELIDDCIVDICPQFTVTHASSSTNITEVGMVAEVKCDTGFRFEDGSTTRIIECASQKKSDTRVFNCQAVICNNPPTVTNAARTVSGTLFGAVVSFTCNDHLRFADGETSKNVTCLQTGFWSESDLSCEADRCPSLPRLSGTRPLSALALANSVATYRCQPGHMFTDGSSRQVVLCNGTHWNNTSDACHVMFCPRIPVISRASVDSNETKFGSEVNITCDRGFTFPTGRSINVICNETGGWTNLVDACQELKCTPQPLVHFAASRVVGTASHGDTITYTCLSGYWVRRGVFTQNISCSAYGEWQPKPTHCIATRCPALSTWAGQYVNTSRHQAGTVVYVTCADEKVFADRSSHAISTCSLDGVWSPKVPDCVDRLPRQKFTAHLKEATHSSMIGAVAIALVGAIFCLLIVVDAPALRDAFLMFKNGPPPRIRRRKLRTGAHQGASRSVAMQTELDSSLIRTQAQLDNGTIDDGRELIEHNNTKFDIVVLRLH